MKTIIQISVLGFLVLGLLSCNKKAEREKIIAGHWKLKNEDAFIDFQKNNSYMVKDERGGEKSGKWSISQKGDSLIINERKGLLRFQIVKITDKELLLYEPIAADSMIFER